VQFENIGTEGLDLTRNNSPRPMEYVWALVAIVLLLAHLQTSDVSDQVITEKHKLLQTCERNTAVAIAALNGFDIREGDVRVACRRVKAS
jgi:hypothetical protein